MQNTFWHHEDCHPNIRRVHWMHVALIFGDALLSKTFSWVSYQYSNEYFCCSRGSPQTMLSYNLTAMTRLIKLLNSHISWLFWREDISNIIWYLFSENRGFMFRVKNRGSIFETHGVIWYWKNSTSSDYKECCVLSCKIAAHFTAVHWSQPAVKYWDKCWPILCHFHMTPFFRRMGPPCFDKIWS